MSDRTSQEAVRHFLAQIKAVIGCVAAEGVVARYPGRSGDQRTATFQGGLAMLRQRSGQFIKLEVDHRFVVTRTDDGRGPWLVHTAEYIYEVANERDEPIIAFHWHPVSARVGDAVPWPHLHAYGARADLTLHRLHPPTGRVSFEAIVRFLLQDLDVIPRRSDWAIIVDRYEQAFRAARTWA